MLHTDILKILLFSSFYRGKKSNSILFLPYFSFIGLKQIFIPVGTSLLLHNSLLSVTAFGGQPCWVLSGDPGGLYQIDFSTIYLQGMASLYKAMLILPQDAFIQVSTF